MAKKQSVTITGLLLLVFFFYWARPHSRLLLTILPPSDLYIPLVKESISLKEKKIFPDLQLVHDYVGTYFVGVYIEKIPDYGSPVKSNAELSLTIESNGKILFEEKLSRWVSRFGGPGKKESGVILGSYKVPDNIPFGLSTKATISINNQDPTFAKKYGGLEFFIRRTSDQ